ncbi:MAG: 6-phosphogluconolactonase [Gammaproteobacteria bacterium]|nr:6-phosphogluconolactonase [Gammaproteobacteria bacterium]
MNNVKVYINSEAVAQAAADYIFQKINECVDKKGHCHVVLPGGSTPARCLEILSKESLPWESIHWYPGDERCYPVGHIERNDGMIRAKLFSQQTKYENSFHPIPAELGPEVGAKSYEVLLKDINTMDIVILGMGEDGHTASLFPANPALEDKRSVVPVYNAPKAPDERVSLGLSILGNAGECIVIATGENKKEALEKIKKGIQLPVSRVEPDVWFVDEAAFNI